MRMMRSVLFFAMVVMVTGCVSPLDHAVFDDGNTFNFNKLDSDRDGYITGTFVDACKQQLRDQSRIDDCLDQLDENGNPGVGTISQGLQANDCDDNDGTVYPGAPELCDGKDNNCNGEVDEGIVCGCLDDGGCNDGVFCNGAETCSDTNECQAGTPPCGDLACDEENDVCVQCLVDDDCAGTETCTDSFVCEPVVCADDGDECTQEVVVDHACVNQPIVGCCHSGPGGDAECASSTPADLPSNHIWGCSTDVVSPDNVHMCTSCLDQDGDGYCGMDEICGNGFDDDGDGVVDEAECVSNLCALYGAWIKNKTASSLDVVYHTYTFNWELVPPTTPEAPPYQNFMAFTMDPGVPLGGDCLLGVDVVPSCLYDRATWLGMTNAQQQAVCEENFVCKNADGLDALPVINPADPEHSCFCHYSATPILLLP